MKSIIHFKQFLLLSPSCRRYNKQIKRIDKTQTTSDSKTYNLSFKAIFADIESKKNLESKRINAINDSSNRELDLFSSERDLHNISLINRYELSKVESRKRKKLITMRFFSEVFYHGTRFDMDMFNHKIYGRNNVLSSISWDFEENIYNDKVDELQLPLKRDLEMKAMEHFEKHPVEDHFSVRANMELAKTSVSLIENDKMINYDSDQEIDYLFDTLRNALDEEQENEEKQIYIKDFVEMNNDEEYSIDQWEPNEDLTGLPQEGENESTDKSFFAKKSNDFKFHRVWRKRIAEAKDPNVTSQIE